MSGWYYNTGGLLDDVVGPVSSSELRELAERGSLTSDSEVCHEKITGGQWISASRIKELKSRFDAMAAAAVVPLPTQDAVDVEIVKAEVIPSPTPKPVDVPSRLPPIAAPTVEPSPTPNEMVQIVEIADESPAVAPSPSKPKSQTTALVIVLCCAVVFLGFCAVVFLGFIGMIVNSPDPFQPAAKEAPPFQEIADNARNMTGVQWKKYARSLSGTQITSWRGRIVDVREKTFSDVYQLWIDMDGGGIQDVYYPVAEHTAMKYDKGDSIVFSGRIDSVTNFMGVSIRLH